MKRIFLLLALLSISLQGAILAPPVFVEGDVDHPFEMGWEREGIHFGFFTDGRDVTLALEVPQNYWQELSSKEKPLFRRTCKGSYVMGYSTAPVDPWEAASAILERREASFFEQPLKGDGVLPNLIDHYEVKEWVKGKRVLFYTGAGISIASGIPDMKSLEEQLGFNSSAKEIVQKWIYIPDEITEEVISFREACLNSPPSKGHHALSHLSIATNQQILTENIDWMHERGGTRPQRISKEAVSVTDSFDDIDAIICVGLSTDDKGFLSWIKKHQPQIKLIAVNPACPHYLSNEDLWCPGDAHEILEKLATETMTNKLSFIALNR